MGSLPSDGTNVISGISSHTEGIAMLVITSGRGALIGVVVGCVGSQ